MLGAVLLGLDAAEAPVEARQRVRDALFGPGSAAAGVDGPGVVG